MLSLWQHVLSGNHTYDGRSLLLCTNCAKITARLHRYVSKCSNFNYLISANKEFSVKDVTKSSIRGRNTKSDLLGGCFPHVSMGYWYWMVGILMGSVISRWLSKLLSFQSLCCLAWNQCVSHGERPSNKPRRRSKTATTTVNKAHHMHVQKYLTMFSPMNLSMWVV